MQLASAFCLPCSCSSRFLKLHLLWWWAPDATFGHQLQNETHVEFTPLGLQIFTASKSMSALNVYRANLLNGLLHDSALFPTVSLALLTMGGVLGERHLLNPQDSQLFCDCSWFLGPQKRASVLQTGNLYAGWHILPQCNACSHSCPCNPLCRSSAKVRITAALLPPWTSLLITPEELARQEWRFYSRWSCFLLQVHLLQNRGEPGNDG